MKNIILKAIFSIIIFIFIYFVCISLFIYPCTTDGMSMFPTISPNEIKFTNRWKVITKEEIKRGDIVVFEEPKVLYVSREEFDKNNILAQYDNLFNINLFKKKWMKRIIGLPKDHIQITEKNELFVNGEKLGYANRNDYIGDYMYIDLIVPENSVYVLGDNRKDSIDSRSFGCVPMDKIYSIVF